MAMIRLGDTSHPYLDIKDANVFEPSDGILDEVKRTKFHKSNFIHFGRTPFNLATNIDLLGHTVAGTLIQIRLLGVLKSLQKVAWLHKILPQGSRARRKEDPFYSIIENVYVFVRKIFLLTQWVYHC